MIKCEERLVRWCRHEVAVEQGWSDVAEYISVGMHGGSHLARHHCSGEQLVQLNQLVGCGVKLERNAVQRVPRFHLDHKTRERTQKSHSGIFKVLHREDVKTDDKRLKEFCNYSFEREDLNGALVLHVRFWDVTRIKAVRCSPGINSHGEAALLAEIRTDMNVSSGFVIPCETCM